MAGKKIHLDLREVKEQQARRQHIIKTKITQAPRNEKKIVHSLGFIRKLKQRPGVDVSSLIYQLFKFIILANVF